MTITFNFSFDWKELRGTYCYSVMDGLPKILRLILRTLCFKDQLWCWYVCSMFNSCIYHVYSKGNLQFRDTFIWIYLYIYHVWCIVFSKDRKHCCDKMLLHVLWSDRSKQWDKHRGISFSYLKNKNVRSSSILLFYWVFPYSISTKWSLGLFVQFFNTTATQNCMPKAK